MMLQSVCLIWCNHHQTQAGGWLIERKREREKERKWEREREREKNEGTASQNVRKNWDDN